MLGIKEIFEIFSFQLSNSEKCINNTFGCTEDRIVNNALILTAF